MHPHQLEVVAQFKRLRVGLPAWDFVPTDEEAKAGGTRMLRIELLTSQE